MSLKISTSASEIPDTLREELSSLIRGRVYLRSDREFLSRSVTWNGKLKSVSRMLVSPLDAQDVSKVILFCKKHNLSPSVKACGYGIAGWSIAGDVIIDLSMLRGVEIEEPQPHAEGERDWTSLRNTLLSGSKGKGRGGAGTLGIRASSDSGTAGGTAAAPESVPQNTRSASTKRPREDSPPPDQPPANPLGDGEKLMRSYDNASHAVAEFLSGPPLPHEEGGEKPREPPSNRRRLHSPTSDSTLTMPALQTRQVSGESATSTAGSTSGSAIDSSGTADTTPGPSPMSASRAQSNSEPFGYLSASPAQPPRVMHSGDPFSYAPSPSTTFPSLGNWRPPVSYGLAGGGAFGFPRAQQLSSFPSLPSFGPGSGLGQTIVAPAKPVHAHAYVAFGAGMRQKEVDTYTANNPLEGISAVTGEKQDGLVPYHVPTAAHPVGSSIMILAGFGFLSRLYGLSVDNLVEVEMVLANGQIIIVDENSEPDLWWAIRGAGPALGIMTRYKARAFPVPVVFAGNLIYRFHRATAPSLIKHFRDCIKGAPRELYANVLLTSGPADKDSLIVIQMCYIGPKEKGMEYLHAISSWDGERCLLNEVNEKTFLSQQDSVAQVLRGKAGRQWFIRSSLITALSDEVINKTVIRFSNTPIGCTWLFELSGGAISDFEDTCLPKEQREATWTVAALHQWEMGIDDPRCITSAEEWMKETIGPVAIGGPYPTFLGRHEPPHRVMACYGKNWARLVEVKRKYDPDCFFRNTFWPLDKDGQPIEILTNEPPSP